MSKKFTQEELNKVLWSAADSSRSSVDAVIYKDYALTMLFFKYLSDKSRAELAHWQARIPNDPERIKKKLKNSRFYLPPGTSFASVYKQKEQDNIGEIVNLALSKIEKHNQAKLDKVLTSTDFNSEAILGKLSQRSKMVRDLLDDFAKIDLSATSEDIIGNATCI